MIDGPLADALGIHRDTDPPGVARALLRCAGIAAPHDIFSPAAVWLAAVADALGEYLSGRPRTIDPPRVAERVAREATPRLGVGAAPAVLALVAPAQRVPPGTAGELGRACRALVARHLPGLLVAVLADWSAQGLIVSVDDPGLIGDVVTPWS